MRDRVGFVFNGQEQKSFSNCWVGIYYIHRIKINNNNRFLFWSSRSNTPLPMQKVISGYSKEAFPKKHAMDGDKRFIILGVCVTNGKTIWQKFE